MTVIATIAWSTMNKPNPLLYSKVAANDAVMVTVLNRSRPGERRAKILKIYSARKGIRWKQLGRTIDFVPGPDVYGNGALEVGKTGIVFLRLLHGKLYEDPWRGHLLIEEIDGQPHVIFPHMVPSSDGHEGGIHLSLYSVSRPDPKRTYTRAVRLKSTEDAIRDLIRKIDSL